jgi:hypothetical protein
MGEPSLDKNIEKTGKAFSRKDAKAQRKNKKQMMADYFSVLHWDSCHRIALLPIVDQCGHLAVSTIRQSINCDTLKDHQQ